MDFAYDGGEKPGAGGTATLYVNGKSVGSRKVPKTQFAVFSADETAGVGIDMETTVSEDYDRADQQVHRQDRQGDHHAEVAEDGCIHPGNRVDTSGW